MTLTVVQVLHNFIYRIDKIMRDYNRLNDKTTPEAQDKLHEILYLSCQQSVLPWYATGMNYANTCDFFVAFYIGNMFRGCKSVKEEIKFFLKMFVQERVSTKACIWAAATIVESHTRLLLYESKSTKKLACFINFKIGSDQPLFQGVLASIDRQRMQPGYAPVWDVFYGQLAEFRPIEQTPN